MTTIEQLRAHLASAAGGYRGDETTLELTIKGLLELADRVELHAEVFGKINERIAVLEGQPRTGRPEHFESFASLITAFIEQRERVRLLEAVVGAARDFHAQVIRKLADPDAPLVDRLTEQLTRLNAAEMRFGG